MPPAKRYSAPTNTIKLTFDFDTLDRLKAEAAGRKVDATRCAYELIQEKLGLRTAPPATIAAPVPPEDELAASVRRGLDAARSYPRGD